MSVFEVSASAAFEAIPLLGLWFQAGDEALDVGDGTIAVRTDELERFDRWRLRAGRLWGHPSLFYESSDDGLMNDSRALMGNR